VVAQHRDSASAGRVVLEESGAVLYGQREVIGYGSWGSNDGNRKRRFPGFEWLPGAIATEYVSPTAEPSSARRAIGSSQAGRTARTSLPARPGSGGRLPGGGATACRATSTNRSWVHAAAGLPVSGLLLGRNLAESYYLAIPALSWQNIVVGDPLCSLGRPPR